jgi:hypothetical protein
MDAGKTQAQNQIKGGPGFWQQGGDILKEAVRSMAEGAGEMFLAGGEGLRSLADMDPNAASKAAVKLINGLMTGTGRLSDSAKVLGALAWDKVAGDPYGLYKAGKDAQYSEYLRKTQGFSMVPGSSQEEIESGLKLGNIMDITLLLPMVSAVAKGMTKGGEAVATQTMEELTKAMAERSAESLGRRAVGQVLENVGAITEKVGSLSAVGDSLTRGFLRTEGVRQAAAAGTGIGAIAAGTVLPDEGAFGYAGTALKTYGTLRLAQVAGAGTKWAGKILGSEETASKIVQEALRNAEVQGAERMAVKLIKNIPDPVVRMTRKVMDGAMIPAAIGATLSGAQEASDPFSTPLSIAEATVQGGAAGAAAGGLISGGIGIVPEFTGKAAEQAFVREILTDLTTRPQERSFVIGNQDVRIPDDIQNRLNVLNSDTMTTRQKASLFGILDSAEHAGVDVAFINDATPLPDALGGSGANMGKGVKFVNDGGKTTIFVNADQINHTGAIHEVMHAYTSDQVATDFVRNLSKERGGELGAFQELGTMAQKYYDTQVQTNPAAAEQIKANIDRMNDPQVPLQDRLVAATNLAHEYIAEGMAQSLSDAKPESLQDFRGSTISAIADKAFRGALEKVYTATGMSSVGATHDPISGHFYKDGKIISSQPLAEMTKKVRTAINTRTNVPVSPEAAARPFVERVPRDVPIVGETMQNGGRVVAVEPRATYEDTHPNGALTTEAEKAVYHKAIYEQVAQAMGSQEADPVMIQQGVYPGNISTKGTPIIYADKLTPQYVSALFQAQTQHGTPLIAPENRESVARFAQALNDGHLVTVTHSVNVGKSTGKDRAYTARIAQVGLPMAFSMTSGKKGSGPKMEFFNLSLANDMINLNRTYSPAIDTALRDLRINSLDDVIPYAKAYIDNLSSTGSVPSTRALAAVAPEGASVKSLEFMRDMLHMSSAIQPRAKRGEVRINEPYMDPAKFRNVPKPELEAVTPKGEKFRTTLSREQVGVQSIRLDGISDVQLYQPNGQPVQVNVNKPQLVNKIRANFSPATSKREVLPGGETITDNVTGERMFISPKGKVKLFGADGKLAGVFQDEEAAVLKSNQAKLKTAEAETKARLSADVTKKVPELVDAAKQYRAGEITQQEYLNAVKLYAPYSEFRSIPEPSTMEGMQRALTKDKVGQIGRASQSLQAGDTVGLRLDIPAYRDHGEWVVSVHDQSPGGAGKVVGYEPVAIANNVEFSSSPAAAMGIATGEKPKSSFARMVGSWEPASVEAAMREARVAMESPEYIQVGMNPAKHSYFFDRKDGRPIVAADRVVQIGGLVFAKKPVFAEPSDARFATKQNIRFSPARTAAERRAAELATEERKYGVSSRTVPVSMILNEGEEISRAMNEIIREGIPTFAGKVQDPELAGRLATSQAVLDVAAKEDALGRKVNAVARKRREIQRRQAEIEAAVAKREAEGTIGPVPVGLRPLPAVKTLKELGDIPGGGPTKLPSELKVTPDQLRQVFRNLDVEEFPTPQEAPPAVTDLISQKTPRSEITHRTVLGKIQNDAAKAARVGDMKIDQMLKAMGEKREAIFDAELARVRNKFDTMELQGKAEEARQAGIDPEIVRLRNEHFANVQQQIAQAAEPAPLNSGTTEPPAQTLLPNMATAADDPRIPRDVVIQAIRGKFKIWSIGRQSVQAVTDTYQEALKKAQAIQLKRRKKSNAT